MLNDAYGWRNALIVFGVCGLPIAALVWAAVREPRRGQQDDTSVPAASTASTFRETLTFVINNRAVFHVVAGCNDTDLLGGGVW